MLDYSTRGDAWGNSWGDAWGCLEQILVVRRGGVAMRGTQKKFFYDRQVKEYEERLAELEVEALEPRELPKRIDEALAEQVFKYTDPEPVRQAVKTFRREKAGELALAAAVIKAIEHERAARKRRQNNELAVLLLTS
mgnify:CR=1 FL=1